jgi:hypothetical protein
MKSFVFPALITVFLVILTSCIPVTCDPNFLVFWMESKGKNISKGLEIPAEVIFVPSGSYSPQNCQIVSVKSAVIYADGEVVGVTQLPELSLKTQLLPGQYGLPKSGGKDVAFYVVSDRGDKSEVKTLTITVKP